MLAGHDDYGNASIVYLLYATMYHDFRLRLQFWIKMESRHKLKIKIISFHTLFDSVLSRHNIVFFKYTIFVWAIR